MFLAGCLMVALSFFSSLSSWIALRLMIGFAFGAITTSCETLINRISTEQNRGRNLGLYAFAFSLSLMISPLALWLLTFGRGVPFITGGIVCFATALLIYKTIPSLQEELPHVSIDLQFIRRISLSLATNFMAGFMEGALIALIPLYALRQGFSARATGYVALCLYARPWRGASPHRAFGRPPWVAENSWTGVWRGNRPFFL